MATCPTCATPLPSYALFCPRCGASTPTGISQETGATASPPPAAPTVEAMRERRATVQRALGTAFELRDLIGQGGFGEVWAAVDVKLKRDVAVKVLREDLVASPSLLERFRREAEAAAKLRHPNIVPIYQVGEAEGLVFFVMPLVKGESLRALLEREGRLEVAEAVRILTEAAGALQEAHEAGIVHRDIKPDNILLEGAQRRVLLMDFGIAKSLEAAEGGLTGTGMVIGTPQYMSPEQATGEKRIDARSDIYSLGVLAYQLLSGRLPFEAESAQAMIVAHITTPPEPIEKVRTGVPEELAAAVMRALAKKPEVRWPTAEAFAAAIRPPAPVGEESPLRWVTRRLRKSVARTGQRLRLYGIAVVVLAIGLGVFGRGAVSDAVGFWWRRAFAESSEYTEYRGGAELPWSWAYGAYRGLGFVVPMSDTAVLFGYDGPGSGAAVFNGSTWRVLPVPGAIVPRPVVVGDRVIVTAWDGRRTGIYEVQGGRSILRDSLPERVSYAFGFDSTLVLGTTRGKVIRGRPGGWRRETTGEGNPVRVIWGDRNRQAAVIGSSLVLFDGTRWGGTELTCSRREEGRVHCWNFEDVLTLPNGALALFGYDEALSADDQSQGIRGLALTWQVGAPRFQQWSEPLPQTAAFQAAALQGSGALWLFGKADAVTDQTPVWRLSGSRIDTLTTNFGDLVAGAAALRGGLAAYTYSTGSVWSSRGRGFEVVSEAPSSIFSGCDTLGCWTEAASLPDGSSQATSRVVLRGRSGDTVWWLGRSGQLISESCTRIANVDTVCSIDPPTRSAQRRRWSGLWRTALGAVASSGGAVYRWSMEWVPMATSGGSPDSVVSLAAGSGSVLFLLSRSAVWRWDSVGQRWATWQRLPAWLIAPRLLAVDSAGTVALVIGDGIMAAVRASGVQMIQSGLDFVSAAVVLPDHRAVVSLPTPDDPRLGGRLVISSPLDRAEVELASIRAPMGADIYWLGVSRRLPARQVLEVAGAQRNHTIVDVEALPFAVSEWGAVEVAGLPHGAHAWIDRGSLNASNPGVGRYVMLAKPGARRVTIAAPEGTNVFDKTVRVVAGQTLTVQYPR